jgi:flagellar hook-associated protein 2
MADINFGGLATGLPTEDLVKSLMAVERKPIDRLESRKEQESFRLKAYAQLDTKLEALRSTVRSLSFTSGVRTTKVQLNSEESISASSNGAAKGNYLVSVAQLAQVQKSVTTGLSSDTGKVLGTGKVTIGSVEIKVDSSNNSLQGLMASINSVSGDTGVTASIINDGKGSNNYHMVLTGKDAATSFSLTVDLKDAENNQIDFSASNVRSAQQAKAYVDGIEVVSNSNTLTGAIAGVTINLNKTSNIITPASGDNPPVYETTNLDVVSDDEALKEKVSTFVSSYNAVMEWIVSGYRDTSETATTATDTTDTTTEEDSLADYLRGDATVNGVKRSLQSVLGNAVNGSGSLHILSEIGISTTADGTLSVNDSKLATALNTKFDDVVKLLAGDDNTDGVMKKFNTLLVDMTSSTDGMYADKKDKYDSTAKNLDLQISQKEALMDKIELRIRTQFNAMELLVSNLNSQGDYLTQQMDMLSNLGK